MALTLSYNAININPNGYTPIIPSINSLGLTLNLDRDSLVNPSGTITIYDSNNNLLATIHGSDPEISIGRQS